MPRRAIDVLHSSKICTRRVGAAAAPRPPMRPSSAVALGPATAGEGAGPAGLDETSEMETGELGSLDTLGRPMEKLPPMERLGRVLMLGL